MKQFRHAPLSAMMLFGLANAFTNTAFANTSDEIHTTLDPLVVTATKIPTKTSNVIAQTSVIDSKTLANFKGKTALEVLANQAGIGITQSGGVGATSNVYLRGYNSQNILVLIDGVRYGSATTGTPALHLLPAEQIDRIEILYGASGTSLYGADAVGGVIAIFTKGTYHKNGVLATLGAGSHKSQLASVGATFANSGTRLSTHFGYFKTDGFNAVKTGENFNADNDGYQSTNASINMAHSLTNKIQMGASVLYNQSKTDIDSFGDADYDANWTVINTYPAHPNAHAKQKNGAVNGFLAYQGDNANMRFLIGQSMDKSITFDNAKNNDLGAVFNTKQNQAKLESQFKANDNTFVLMGIEHLTQKIDSTTNYDLKSRKINSGFLGYQIVGDYYDTQGNWRVDDNSQFGKQTHYNLGIAIKPVQGFRLGANYATGFRMPTFNELYYPNWSNPNLKPEYSKNSEVFAELTNKFQKTRLTAYQNRIDNKIINNQNQANAKIKGISLSSDWRFDNGMVFGVGLEKLNAQNLSQQDNNGNPYQLVYSPKNSYGAYIGYDNGIANIQLNAKQVGERFTNANNSEKLDDYTLLNLSGGYQLTPRLRMDARIDNLTDEQYTLSSQFGTVYQTDGRHYFGSMTYQY